MRTLVVLIAGIAVLVAARDVGAQQDISGQWRLGARSDEGLPPFGLNSVVTLVQEGQSLSVTFQMGRGGPTNSMTGSLVGANIRLQWNAGDPANQMVVVFTGTVAERLMTGSVEVGSSTRGTWAAERMPDAIAHPVGTELPNPNPTVITAWGQLPEGRAWGTSAGVDIGPDGHIWTYDRCGQTAFADVCSTSTLDPILKLDRMTGEVLASWGAGMFAFPHGIHVDRDGNVWITDSMGNEAGTVGHQVIKFSPEGEVLMTLGRAGVAGSGADTFNEPNDVITAPNGDIFVADGHSGHILPPPRGATARIMKFTSDGRFIREWGGIGSAPGEFRSPHALAFDSQGRLFVADRGNNRLQIFD